MRVTDQKLEAAIGQMLRAGVLAAAAIVLAGAVLFLGGAGSIPRPDYTHFPAGPAPPFSLSAIWKGVRQADGTSMIEAGLLLLVATPIVRVILAAAGFLLERDWLYFGVSTLVLLVLMYSILLGR